MYRIYLTRDKVSSLSIHEIFLLIYLLIINYFQLDLIHTYILFLCKELYVHLTMHHITYNETLHHFFANQ